jgi:hypothetical protein
MDRDHDERQRWILNGHIPAAARARVVREVTGWIAVARAPEERGRGARWNPPRKFEQHGDLPEVIAYVVGAAAEGSGDIEAWLDEALERPYGSKGARRRMRARATAARWRGDGAAARLWEERAARFDALIKDDRTALLARIAGL